MRDMYYRATSCTRYYFLTWFYAKLVKAGARLQPPYWTGPPVPIWNTTHDDTVVLDYRKKLRAKGEHVRVWAPGAVVH